MAVAPGWRTCGTGSDTVGGGRARGRRRDQPSTPHSGPYGFELSSPDPTYTCGVPGLLEVREKISKGDYIDIFDLLVNQADKEEVRRCKECAHSRECGPQRKRVEESLSNWVRAFSIYQAILAECFSDLGAQLACYRNRIVGAHDEYGGTAWKE
ncbi:hypothetical protein NDU88_004317 [Pleurodeles waltl]|uniref:Uncharacterized protein n=1 Tax=Pleurodeles waltl TaxID=8319 RepID=A0AAV7KY28_PLEWA|nr:hypothetical protein NDU88_004317 [Pleurodeles waltl]